MAEPVEYDTWIIGSIFSGKLMAEDTGALHKATEALLGCPVMVHQFGRVFDQLKPGIADFCPEIASFDFSDVSPDTVHARCQDLIDIAGAKQTIRTPLLSGQKFDPMEDIPRGTKVLRADPRNLK